MTRVIQEALDGKPLDWMEKVQWPTISAKKLKR